jgi:hypothetical protein
MGDAIDDRFYRNVYEFNPLTRQYEDNGSDLGPAHGVRFVLYDVAAGTLEPGTQVGTLDVEDLSDAETFQVSVRVTGMAQETYADYNVTLPDNGVPISDGFDLVAEGILSRGADPMDFNLHFAQVNPRNQSVKLDLVGPVENLHFDFVDTFNPISENSHTAIDVLLNKGKESVRLAGFQDFDGGSRLYTTDLTLRGNGRIFATSTSDDGGFPVWEKANGDELTQDEQILIGTLLSGVFDSVFPFPGVDAVRSAYGGLIPTLQGSQPPPASSSCTTSSLFRPAASAEKLVNTRWRRTAGATVRTSSRSAIGRPSSAARALAPRTRY